MKPGWKMRMFGGAKPVSDADASLSDAPLHADWAWRPDLWAGSEYAATGAPLESGASLGEGVTLFHDCSPDAVSVTQIGGLDEEASPHDIVLETEESGGGFVSLVFDLPGAGARRLRRDQLLGVRLGLHCAQPVAIFGRLNLSQGPNVKQAVRRFERSSGSLMLDFDLTEIDLNEGREARVWIDLIFEKPGKNRISVSDVLVSRRPRAEIT